MNKIMTIPSSLDEIYETKNIVDGFIIGIKNYCVNVNYCIDDLNILNDLCDKDIFIAINKNLDNKDLPKLRELLLELNNYNIIGVIFYDIGLLNMYNNLDLSYDLVWGQEHLTTNYNTINFYSSYNVKYTYISSDITLDEIKEIQNNTSNKLLVNCFGYLPMFVSKRHIVKNYLEYFNLNDSSNINYMYKEGKTYPIIDNDIATMCYSANILNGIKEYINLDNCYVVLNSFNIDMQDFIDVINLFKNVNKENVLEYKDIIDKKFVNVDDGFLNTRTIYKVKNEK